MMSTDFRPLTPIRTTGLFDGHPVSDVIQIGDLPKDNIVVLTDSDGCTVAIKLYQGQYISVVLADGPVTENDNDILRARRELVEMGLVVDSGRRKLSKRTGRYEIVWQATTTGG
jgi:hypothetical protein